jgi:glutamine amidotransferase
MKIVVIEYQGGNTRSVLNALERLGYTAQLSAEEAVLRQADRVIFPGVGAAAATMQHLQTLGLDQVIPRLQRPILGICLGMQLLGHFSEEGHTPLLDLVPAMPILRFPPQVGKVPHVGWNSLDFQADHPLFKGLSPNAYVYYVHSYYAPTNPQYTIAQTEYGGLRFTGALAKGDCWAVQFHPEKSGAVGEQILRNFLEHRF